MLNRELATPLHAVLLEGQGGRGELTFGLWGYFLFISHRYGVKITLNLSGNTFSSICF